MRRRRVRLENRLRVLEAAIQVQPRDPPPAPLTDPEQIGQALAVLASVMGEQGLARWLEQRTGGGRTMDRWGMGGRPEGTDHQVGIPDPESEDGGRLDGELWNPDRHDLGGEGLIDSDEEG